MDYGTAASGGGINFLSNVGFFIFTLSGPAALILAIKTEIKRKEETYIGYPEEVKNSNIITMSILFVIYLIILVIWYKAL